MMPVINSHSSIFDGQSIFIDVQKLEGISKVQDFGQHY